MNNLDNNLKRPIETDPTGFPKIVDESVSGLKAIPIVVVNKNKLGEFVYDKDTELSEDGVNNRMSTKIKSDSMGNTAVVDESSDGSKAVPIVFVEKDNEGSFIYADNPASSGEPGEKGDTGEQGPQGEQGPPGSDGKDGANGGNGSDGKDGVGISDIKIEGSEFVFSMSNGETIKVEIPGNDA